MNFSSNLNEIAEFYSTLSVSVLVVLFHTLFYEWTRILGHYAGAPLKTICFLESKNMQNAIQNL